MNVLAILLVSAIVAPSVETRDTIAEVAKDRDYWVSVSQPGSGQFRGGALPYSADGLELQVALPENRGVRWASRNPGPRLLLGAKSMVVRMGEECTGGKISVALDPVWPSAKVPQPKGVENPKGLRVSGDWKRETTISLDHLDRRFGWIVKGVYFNPPRGMTNVVARFRGIDALYDRRPVDALTLDVGTGRRIRYIRPELGEGADLVVCNTSARELTFSAELSASDYFGRKVALSAFKAQQISAGETCRRRLPEFPGKGLWRIVGVFECEGMVCTQEARIACIDAHRPRTEKRPLGTFRAGIQSHVERYSPAVRRDLIEAAQAAGSRIVRGGMALQWSTVERERGVFDWSLGDRLVAEYANAGMAIDTLIHGTPNWAKDLSQEEWRAALGEYMGKLAERYRGRIDYYEYGNEFDLRQEPSVEECAAILHAMHGPVKASDPDARVILGGMACPDSTRSANRKVRRGFHEGVMTAARGDYDAHAVHVHSPFSEYAPKIDFLLDWRQRLGITAPWFANETAITICSVGEEEAARMVWQKIIYAWSRGSADYVWYNDFATIRVDGHREGGYGLIDDEFRPRATYAAFAALQAALADGSFDAILRHTAARDVVRFRKDGDFVLAGWDSSSESNALIRVRTDASSAEVCDLMGNRTRLPLRDGVARWAIGRNPSALILRGASVAEPDAGDLKLETKPTAVVVVSDVEYRAVPDLLLFGADQVHELYEAIPQYEHRNWRWAADLSARVFVARRGGELRVRIAVEDDVHSPRADQPTEGDAVLVKLGDKELMLVEGATAPLCDGKPLKKAKLAVERKNTQTVYELSVPTPLVGAPTWAPFSAIALNLRIYDADAEGPDCWMEFRPWNVPAAEVR